MEVVLLKAVKGLGKAGDVKKVADGYARNYLLRLGLAVPASEAALKQLAAESEARKLDQVRERAAAEEQAGRLENVSLVFKMRVGDSGQLYGSVTNADIAERLSADLGEEIDKRKVLLGDPLKEIGSREVDVRLHSGVRITVKVIVEADAN